jgi:hypothetical protein
MLKCLVIEDHKDKGIAANIINQALDEYTRMVEVSLYDINYIKHNYISDHFDFVVLIHDNTIYHKYHVESISERTTDKEMRDQPLHYYREGEVPIFDFMSLSFSSFISAYDISVSYSPSSKTPWDNPNVIFQVLLRDRMIVIISGYHSHKRDGFVNRIRGAMDDVLKKHVFDDYFRLLREERDTINHIIRSIEFPPEYHQAGLSVLNYFGTLINQRYPEIPVTVRIEQEGLKVRLTIQTPEGHRDIVEQTLQAYGLIVTGRMAPEELLENPYQVMALKHKLDMVAMELRHTRELLQSAERYNEQQQGRVLSLEADVTHLRQFVGSSLQHNQELTMMLQSLLSSLRQQHDTAVHQALSTLKEVLARGITHNDEEAVKGALSTIKEKEPGVFCQMIDLIGKGAITGTAGRLLYDWLMHLSTVLR